MEPLRVTSEPVGTDGRYLVAGVGGAGPSGCRRRYADAPRASGERRRSTPSFRRRAFVDADAVAARTPQSPPTSAAVAGRSAGWRAIARSMAAATSAGSPASAGWDRLRGDPQELAITRSPLRRS